MKDAAGDVSHVVGARPGSARVLFVDALRFIAAFQMLQGHTIAALLAPAYRHGPLYAFWFTARGLTSVAFLFTAGFAFQLTTSRDYERRHRSTALFARRARRALSLLALGYALHAPFALWLSDEPQLRAAAVRGFVGVDVLQCIGVSLFILQVLTWLSPSERLLGASAGVVALALFVLTPSAAHVVPTGAFAPLTSYLSPRSGSLFPLLPWAGHMFAGAACASWLARPSRFSSAQRLLALGLLASALGFALHRLFSASPQVPDQIGRLGRVLLVSAGLSAWLARARMIPASMEVLASETLFLYAFHVLIVYGAGLGLADQVGARLAPAPAVACAALVVGLSFGVALWRQRVQVKRLAAAAQPG